MHTSQAIIEGRAVCGACFVDHAPTCRHLARTAFEREWDAALANDDTSAETVDRINQLFRIALGGCVA